MAARCNGKVLSIVFGTLLLGRAIAGGGHAAVLVELQMERWAARGGAVRLRCAHDVPPHLLGQVVFLRQGAKIFQYIRNRKPPYRNFTTAGAVLNVALATDDSIILQNLELEASGRYSCEVSLDTPIYTKASAEKQLTVFQPQKHHPRIEVPPRAPPRAPLRARCTTAPSAPAPHVTWFINGKKIDEVLATSHKYRVSRKEQSWGSPSPASSAAPLLALRHTTHVATLPPTCVQRDRQAEESRHKWRRRELMVTVSEVTVEASGRLQLTCVSTIPEFRSIRDKFADIRNETVIVEAATPTSGPPPTPGLAAARGASVTPASPLLFLCILYTM